jgi:hypothetical protein
VADDATRTSNPAEAVGWITTVVLARDLLGSDAKGLGRAGRDWCQANGVPYERRGKLLWVKLADVRAAIERGRAPDGPCRVARTPMRKAG